MHSSSFIMNKKIYLFFSALAIFGLIAYFVATNEVLAFDTLIRESIYGIRNDTLTSVMIFITYLGNWQTVTLLCLVALIFPKTRNSYGLSMSLSPIFSSITYKLLKTLFARSRPDTILHLIHQGGYSFPSGHSMTGFVFYGMIIWLCTKNLKNKTMVTIITVILSMLILLIGFSRIYLGVHFPTDVLAGWVLGVAILTFLTSIEKYIRSK